MSLDYVSTFRNIVARQVICPQSRDLESRVVALPLLLVYYGPLKLMVERSLGLHLIGAGEQEVNGLQCGTRCLGIERPDHYGVDEIEDCKDDVGLISDILESRWGDFDDDEVAEKICGRGQGSTFCADLQW